MDIAFWNRKKELCEIRKELLLLYQVMYVCVGRVAQSV